MALWDQEERERERRGREEKQAEGEGAGEGYLFRPRQDMRLSGYCLVEEGTSGTARGWCFGASGGEGGGIGGQHSTDHAALTSNCHWHPPTGRQALEPGNRFT